MNDTETAHKELIFYNHRPQECRHARGGDQCTSFMTIRPGGGFIMYFFQSESVFRRSLSLAFSPLQQLACMVYTRLKSWLHWQYPLKYFVSRKTTSRPLRAISRNLIRFNTSCSFFPGYVDFDSYQNLKKLIVRGFERTYMKPPLGALWRSCG